MERFQSGLFRRIVLIHMTQALVLSITGIVDSAIVGQFWEAEGLAGMKLAMPVVSILYMIGSVLSTGLSVQVTKLLAKGKRTEANQYFIWVCTAAAVISFVLMIVALILAAAAPLLVKLFTKDIILQNMGTYAFRWYLLGVPFMSFNIASGSYLQGLDRQKEAGAFTMINQLILPVLITWLMGRPFDLTERYKLLNPDDPVSGLGLRIVFAAAENVNYSHAFDMNNVCIRVLKQSSRGDVVK